MPLPAPVQADLNQAGAPEHEVVLSKANEFLARTGKSVANLAGLVGLGESTLHLYFRGRYGDTNGNCSTRWVDARLWRALDLHWPKPAAKQYGQVLPTAMFKKLHGRLKQCIHDGAIILIYGPPASEKSFALENLVAQRWAVGKKDALYIYCDQALGPLALLRRVAREAQVWIRSNQCEPIRQALLDEWERLPHPPALILDEAQHLPVETLEIVRGLHDRSRRGKGAQGGSERPGCGILLAGSHDLYSNFTRPANESRMAQWTSRIDYRDQLAGMSREEVLQIAARELGNGKPARVTQEQQEKIIERCTKLDAYATDGAGKPAPREYLSCRALVKYCDQIRKKREAA